MPIHQAELAGRKSDRTRNDPEAEAAYLRGESTLGRALGVGDEMFAAIRRQARALFDAGRFERARDVLLGISALGRVHPADLELLAGCYRALGDHENADQVAAHAKELSSLLGEEQSG
jgi:hypothetical protein